VVGFQVAVGLLLFGQVIRYTEQLDLENLAE
jgi:hypothetical protein